MLTAFKRDGAVKRHSFQLKTGERRRVKEALAQKPRPKENSQSARDGIELSGIVAVANLNCKSPFFKQPFGYIASVSVALAPSLQFVG